MKKLTGLQTGTGHSPSPQPVTLATSMTRNKTGLAVKHIISHKLSSLYSTCILITLKKKCYKEKLMALKLPTFKYRRIRGDMIEVYKLLTNMYDDNTVQLDLNSDSRTEDTPRN